MKLYKYLSPERIDVLKNRSIRFSPPIAFNDPFEFKPVISSVASDNYIRQYMEENIDSMVELLKSELPVNIRDFFPQSKLREMLLLYINSNIGVADQLMGPVINKLSTLLFEKSNENIGVLSLTEKSDNLLMWSHYADSHRGYCIGFNSNHEFFNRKRSKNDEFSHLRKVEYLERRPSKSIVEMNGTDIFLLKSDVWKYEQEWRMCAILSEADTIIHTTNPSVNLFNFPAGILDEIIIGVNADASLTDSILSFIRGNSEFGHVEVKRASVSNREYSLCFHNL